MILNDYETEKAFCWAIIRLSHSGDDWNNYG